MAPRKIRKLRKRQKEPAAKEEAKEKAEETEDESSSKKKKAKCPRRPPDGGWSWMVLLGVFIINMTTQSLFSISGLLFAPAIKSWGYHISEVAGVSTVMIAVQNFFGTWICVGLATGLLLKKYSIRVVGSAGTLLVFIGLVLTSFTSEVWQLFVTWGFLVGIGMALIVPTAFLVLTLYFERFRRYAVGIAMSGTGVGQMILPLTVQELLSLYEFSGACLLISSFALQALIGYALCRPRQKRRAKILEKVVPVIQATDDSDAETTAKPRKGKCLRACSKAIGLPLLKDPSLANAIICSSIIYMTVACHTAAAPIFMVEEGHLTAYEVAYCLTIASACDLTMRLLMPLIQESFRLGARTVYMVSSAAGAVARSVMAESPTLLVFVVTSVFLGVSRAAIVVNINLALSEVVESRHLMAAIGLSMVFKAFSTLIFGYLLSCIHRLTGNFTLYMHLISLLVWITVLSWLFEVIITFYLEKKRRRREAQLEQDIEGTPDGEPNTEEGKATKSPSKKTNGTPPATSGLKKSPKGGREPTGGKPVKGPVKSTGEPVARNQSIERVPTEDFVIPQPREDKKPPRRLPRNTAKQPKTKLTVRVHHVKKKRSLLKDIYPVRSQSSAVSEYTNIAEREGQKRKTKNNYPQTKEMKNNSDLDKGTARKPKAARTDSTTDKDKNAVDTSRPRRVAIPKNARLYPNRYKTIGSKLDRPPVGLRLNTSTLKSKPLGAGTSKPRPFGAAASKSKLSGDGRIHPSRRRTDSRITDLRRSRPRNLNVRPSTVNNDTLEEGPRSRSKSKVNAPSDLDNSNKSPWTKTR